MITLKWQRDTYINDNSTKLFTDLFPWYCINIFFPRAETVLVTWQDSQTVMGCKGQVSIPEPSQESQRVDRCLK